MASQRFLDLKYTYDRDDGLAQLYAQRQYKDTVTDTILTPITPKFTARVITTTTKVEEPKDLIPRHVISYIINPNVQSGVSKMKLVIPYRPQDLDHTAQLREILGLARVDCIDYFGQDSKSI